MDHSLVLVLWAVAGIFGAGQVVTDLRKRFPGTAGCPMEYFTFLMIAPFGLVTLAVNAAIDIAHLQPSFPWRT